MKLFEVVADPIIRKMAGEISIKSDRDLKALRKLRRWIALMVLLIAVDIPLFVYACLVFFK